MKEVNVMKKNMGAIDRIIRAVLQWQLLSSTSTVRLQALPHSSRDSCCDPPLDERNRRFPPLWPVQHIDAQEIYVMRHGLTGTAPMEGSSFFCLPAVNFFLPNHRIHICRSLPDYFLLVIHIDVIRFNRH